MKIAIIRPALQTAPARIQPPAKLAEPFYASARWRAFAAATKVRRGFRCQLCGWKAGPDGRGLVADHIVERKDGGADFDPANIQIVCTRCDRAKTAMARRARRQE